MPADQRPVRGSTSGAVGRPTRRRTSRRSVLLAGLALPAAAVPGCTLRIGQPAAATVVPPSADELALARAAADADALAAGARAAAALRPDAAALLLAIAGQHAEHARALRPASGNTRATATATATASPNRPPTRASAVPRQRSAEQVAVSAVQADLPTVSGEVARLLASVAASRAVHVRQLAALPSTPPSSPP